MTIDIDDLKRIVSQLSEDERRKLLEAPEPITPGFVWNSNPLGFKATLKYVGKKGKVTRLEIRDYLRSIKLVKDPRNKCRFGIVYNKTGIFFVEDSKSNGDISKDTVILTPMGKELSKLFDENVTRLTPMETVICRGLQQQSAGYTFLSIVGQEPGIHREQLWKRMVTAHKGKGRYFAGYYAALFSRLGLLTTRRAGRWTKYFLRIPEGWVDEAPEAD